MPADFYDLLEVAPDASPEEIRRAYREKAREYHPDVNADERSSDQFKAIRTAYEVLSDASERKDYDRMGHQAYVEQHLGGLPGASDGRSSRRPSDGATGRRARQSGATGRTTGRTSGRSGTAGSRSSGRARSTASTSGDSKSRSNWGERTISEPGARARAMRAGERIGVGPFLVVACLGYLAGLATFLVGSADALATVADALSGGDVDAFLAALRTPGFADPLAFVAPAIEQPSPALLLPVGIVAFPLVLVVHAIRTSRTAWWVPAVLSVGPLVGLGVAANPVIVTVAVDLALYVLLPAMAVLGATAAFLRR